MKQFRITCVPALVLAVLATSATRAASSPSPSAPSPPSARLGADARMDARDGSRDRWTRIAPGIRHLHRTTPEPLSVHVVEVDLSAPGVTIEVTPHEQRWLKTSQFGVASGAVAAMNGGFWSVFDAKAEGLVMHGGRVWPGARDDEFYGFFAITREGRAEISPASVVVTAGRARLLEAVSGLQRMLHLGKVTTEAYCDDGCRFRHPRTAVGTSADGRRVLLVVVDGRQPHSRGIRLSALAELMAGLGAAEAINLDGGGSAAMYLATTNGLVSQPADRRERDVLNHVGVFWRPTRAQLADWRAELARQAGARQAGARQAGRDGAWPGDGPGAGASDRARGPGAAGPSGDGSNGALASPPLPSRAGVPRGLARLLQRHAREWLSPRMLLVVGLPLLLASIAGLALVVRRRRRRRV